MTENSQENIELKDDLLAFRNAFLDLKKEVDITCEWVEMIVAKWEGIDAKKEID